MAGSPPGNSVYFYVRQAGWTGPDAIMATAVALAESSGDPNATSPNPDGGTNVGYFQLDTPGGEGAGYSVAQLKDPALNARVAYAAWVRDGRTFTKHWSTANNGAAAANVAAANKAAGATGDALSFQKLLDLQNSYIKGVQSVPGAAVAAVKAPISAAEAAASALAWLSDPTHWVRIGYGVIGGALVLVGLNAVAKPVTAPIIDTARKAGKTAAAVAAV
jgi:hypothetical protein